MSSFPRSRNSNWTVPSAAGSPSRGYRRYALPYFEGVLLNLRDLGVLDHLTPFLDFFLDVGGKFLGFVGHGIESELGAFFLHVGQRHRLGDLAIEQPDDVFGRSRRYQNALHGFGFLAGD